MHIDVLFNAYIVSLFISYVITLFALYCRHPAATDVECSYYAGHGAALCLS